MWSEISLPIKVYRNKDRLNINNGEYALSIHNLIPAQATLITRPSGEVLYQVENASILGIFKLNQNKKIFFATEKGIYEIESKSTFSLVKETGSRVLQVLEFADKDGVLMALFLCEKETLKYDFAKNTFEVVIIKTLGETSKLTKATSYIAKVFAITGNSSDLWYVPDDGKLFESAWGVISLALEGITIPIVDVEVLVYDKINSLENRLVVIASSKDYSVVKIYQGTDPSDPENWSAKASFELEPTVGSKPLIPFKQDILILTTKGIYSINNLLQGQSEVITGKNNDLTLKNEEIKTVSYAKFKNAIIMDVYNNNQYSFSFYFEPSLGFLSTLDVGYHNLTLFEGAEPFRMFVHQGKIYEFVEDSGDLGVDFSLQTNYFDFGNQGEKKLTLSKITITSFYKTSLKVEPSVFSGAGESRAEVQISTDEKAYWDIAYWFDDDDDVLGGSTVGGNWLGFRTQLEHIVFDANSIGRYLSLNIQGKSTAGGCLLHDVSAYLIPSKISSIDNK